MNQINKIDCYTFFLPKARTTQCNGCIQYRIDNFMSFMNFIETASCRALRMKRRGGANAHRLANILKLRTARRHLPHHNLPLSNQVTQMKTDGPSSRAWEVVRYRPAMPTDRWLQAVGIGWHADLSQSPDVVHWSVS